MLDIRLLRQDPKTAQALLRTKDPSIYLEPLLALDSEVRHAKTEQEQLLARRNQLSKEIGEAKRKGAPTETLSQEVESLKGKLHAVETLLAKLQPELYEQLASLPNLPHQEIPVGSSAKENVCIKTVGEFPQFPFAPKNHLELNEKLHLFDFKRAAKMSGSGWPLYRNWGARLEWALLQFMIDTHVKNGFEQWIPPLLVRKEMLEGVGQLPKFGGQVFKLDDKEHDLYLIPTAEVALNSLYFDEIVDEKLLPAKYVAYTPCFRREAGAAGSQERGLIRMHQFNKVELFSFCRPEESSAIFEEIRTSAESVVEQLGLHYRSMLLSTGDMSFAAAQTVDIEVWLPGQNRYYEVSSVSNCTDFQARSSQIRFKRTKESAVEFVHTLNGSGVATSRLMVAILENNQQADGSVIIPEVLRNYLGGVDRLTPNS